MSDDFCPMHAAVETKIQHLEQDNQAQWKEIDAMDERQRGYEKRFTQILITLIFLLIGVIANLAFAFVKYT